MRADPARDATIFRSTNLTCGKLKAAALEYLHYGGGNGLSLSAARLADRVILSNKPTRPRQLSGELLFRNRRNTLHAIIPKLDALKKTLSPKNNYNVTPPLQPREAGYPERTREIRQRKNCSARQSLRDHPQSTEEFACMSRADRPSPHPASRKSISPGSSRKFVLMGSMMAN